MSQKIHQNSDTFWCIFKCTQQDASLHNVLISVKCSTCFRRFLRPSSGAQYCINSIGYLPFFTATCRCRGSVPTLPRQRQVAVKTGKYPMRCTQFWAPDDGRRNHLKHVEHFTEINTLCKVVSCWVYLKIHLRCTDPWKSNISMYRDHLQGTAYLR
jgi:hypothetical protein